MSDVAQTARMVLRAPQARPAAPIRVPATAVRAAQAVAAVPVSRPSDASEREAAQVARRVVALPARAVATNAIPPAPTRRFAPAPSPARVSLPAGLGVGSPSGQPLPRRVRQDMEPRFSADFADVRVHTGEAAARASRRLNAAAFTAGRDIFFGRGRFQPEQGAGRELIAHELTHTIQQGAAAQAQPLQRSLDTSLGTTVRERAPAAKLHRLGIQDALDYFADKAAWLPGFTMLSFLLGFNPVSLRSVPRTAANLLRALIQLLPGGPLITQALDNHGIVERVATWAEGQLATLGDIGASIRQGIDEFLDSLSWTDIFHLGDLWERAKRIVTNPIDRIITFGAGLVGGIIDFIKDAILRPIAGLVSGTRGYPLLKAVLGFDPITGDAVPRTAQTLLGGFMTLIGQEEVWQNIQRGNAIGQAWAWFQTALAELMGFVRQIPTLFVNAFRSLELVDIVLVPRALAKVIGVFADFASRFVSWGLGTVIKLLEIIFSVVAPGAMGYLRRAGAAIQSIFRNPIGFVMTLVRAAKAGFQNFAGNFLRHLQAGLIAWLTGSLPGIYIPQAFNLSELLKFVLSVLGLSWANLRGKLVREVGETAVRAMEMGFDLVVTLVRDGPAAAWQQLRESLANLRSMVIDGITDMITNFVVTRAIPRLVAMFIPGAGFITAIVSIYETVMTFVNQLSRIAQVVRGFLDSMMAIAAGNISAAATRVESILANLLTLAINFLAGFAGLGRVADRIRAIIERIRAPIDRALDQLVRWIVGMARRLGRFVAQAGVPNDPNERLRLAVRAATAAARGLRGRITAPLLQGALTAIRTRYGLQRIEPFEQGGQWWVRAAINPELTGSTGVPSVLVGPDGRTPARDYNSAGSSARAPEGPNVDPLLAKLRQAVETFTGWTTRGSARSRGRVQQMLRLLEPARDATQGVSEDRARGVPVAILQPRLQALQNQLQTIQGLDPRYRLISIGALALTLIQARQQMPQVPVAPWSVFPGYPAAEYTRQLRDQQDGINAMLAIQWQQNRAQYATAGRSAEGERMQRTFQRRSGNIPGTAAPHNPDQIGAGFPDPTGLPANTLVNSHIGSQWGSRVGTIDNAVNAIEPIELGVTQMNVLLRI
ncbi:MAG: DUF4157 domain-containing protein [Leptothrix sp. (in: b-proteobacteria)]